jgi:hypothetical protein
MNDMMNESNARSCYEMIHVLGTLPKLSFYRFFTVKFKLSANERKLASTRQDDIINTLPDLHDTNGNTMPQDG